MTETYLGDLCRHGHDEGKGKSLRYVNSKQCVECARSRRQQLNQGIKSTDSSRYIKREIQPKKDKFSVSDTHYLGKLCPKVHDYNGTGKSLRYKTTLVCVECQKERGRLYLATEQGKEKRKEQKQKYRQGRQSDKPLYSEKEYQQEYYLRVTKPKRQAKKQQS